ncbi:phoenix [Carassius carassius]|uniref:phoenix n=1 Tax=Carassius carassius TaxID=217509 RepID=UPI00286885D7|nr:phoenix [Carassius carassius]
MALVSEDDTAQLASPSTREKAPVVAHVGDLIDIDPHSELIFETPPPDVVDSINECFEQFTSTVEKRSDATPRKLSSDSDSGESLFITQSRTKAVRTERRLRSSKRPESVSDDSGNGREHEDTEHERGSGGQRVECPKRRKSLIYLPPQRTTFPFLLKSLRRQNLSSKKSQILENSEMGGFLKCIRKIEEGCENTGRAISPSLLESELSDNSEGDDHNSDHEVTKVDRSIFVPSYFKGNKQKWLPQSFLEMRIQGSVSDDNEEQLLNTKGKEKKRKTKSIEKNKASASFKKQSDSKLKAPKSRATVSTSSESSDDSLFMEQQKQHEMHAALASCSDAEHSDSANCRHRLTKQTVQCAENMDGDHLVVIEETQRNSIEAVTEAIVHIEHDDNAGSPSQADDIIGLENTVSDLQSENTTEHVDKINSPVHSDSSFTSKEKKKKKKKKHKLKEQEEAESGADTHSADNVQSAEIDQFTESQTTEMPPKRKKKRKDKERTKTANVEDNNGPDILSNETCETPETEQPQHIQTSEEITEFKSVRKKKKKNGSEKSQYESVDSALDVNSVSQFNNVTDRSTSLKTVAERPSDVVDQTETELNDAEHSDSVQCAENSHLDNFSVIEARQRNSVEAVTEPAVDHEDDLMSDINLLNKSNSLLPPQGGDISIQDDIQQTDSDFGSEDLFRPLNSHKAASVTASMEESDQDSDVTQIETEGQFGSIFGPGTPKWCDGGLHAHEDNDSDETQLETEGKSVSVFGPGTPNKQFTTQDRNSTKHPESQKTDQIPLGLNAEKRKTVLRSHKDSDVTEENMNVQPSSKHLPLADEPLKKGYSFSSKRLNLSKRRAMEEMETDPQETPLFKNDGLSFIKKKRKRKDKLGAINFTQCDTNVDISSDFPAGVETTTRENEKSHEVENRVTMYEEQREASVLHLEDTSEILEESLFSTVADNSVITKVKRKKKKKYKLKEHEDVEPSVENQSVQTVQFSDSQTAELTYKITKKKRKYVEENSATDIPSNETFDSDRPAELRGNDQSSEVPEMNPPEYIQRSEEITGCPLPNVTTLKSVKKKKKKKRDETEEPEYESVELDVNSMSQFDYVDGVVEQQVIKERPSDDNTAEHLEGNTAHILKVAKHKKKSQNASSLFQSDDIIGLEKLASGSQSERAEGLLEKKTKKKQKLKEQKNAEFASDIGGNVQLFQQSDSSTTDLLSRKTKKKRANKDRERTTDRSANEILDHMDGRPSEMRGNNVIQSIEATETNKFEHLQTTEEITRCSSPNVTILSSGKKKKKKVRSEKQHESVDANLDGSQLDVVSGLIAQKMLERRPSDGSAVEHLEGNAAHMSKVAKRKKKSQNASSPSQVDDIIGLENTTEHLEKINSPVLSDSLFTIKEKKKKKHKLKEQEEAESGADTHSADNVQSVEIDQFSESQTTEMQPKRTKKKRKDKERTKTAHIEDNNGPDILSNETCEAPETEQPQHVQTSEEITEFKSVWKKKKKNGSDSALDVYSVSPFDNVTDRSTTQETVEERPIDVLENTEAELNDTKHKKKRKQSSFFVNNNSEFSSSDAHFQETVAPEKKRKKKRNSEHIINVGGELTLESSDHTVPFEKSPSPMLTTSKAITNKSKRKKNKEMNESINHIPDDRNAELETIQTMRTDSVIQHTNAERQANVVNSLENSADIRKKKKKRKKNTENNIMEMSMSQNNESATAVNGDDAPKRPEKQMQRCHDRTGSGARESSVLHKSKKKRKIREESLSVLDS